MRFSFYLTFYFVKYGSNPISSPSRSTSNQQEFSSTSSPSLQPEPRVHGTNPDSQASFCSSNLGFNCIQTVFVLRDIDSL